MNEEELRHLLGQNPDAAALNPELVLDSRSDLEMLFDSNWAHLGGPELVNEVMLFDGVRRWRFDRVCVEGWVVIEIEGGVGSGRHTRRQGFLDDAHKYLAAQLLGYEVFRLAGREMVDNLLLLELLVERVEMSITMSTFSPLDVASDDWNERVCALVGSKEAFG